MVKTFPDLLQRQLQISRESASCDITCLSVETYLSTQQRKRLRRCHQSHLNYLLFLGMNGFCLTSFWSSDSRESHFVMQCQQN